MVPEKDKSKKIEKDKSPSSKFQFSIAIGIPSLVFLLGIFPILSKRYISSFQENVFYAFIVVLFFVVLSMIFSILSEGISFISFLNEEKKINGNLVQYFCLIQHWVVVSSLYLILVL